MNTHTHTHTNMYAHTHKRTKTYIHTVHSYSKWERRLLALIQWLRSKRLNSNAQSTSPYLFWNIKACHLTNGCSCFCFCWQFSFPPWFTKGPVIFINIHCQQIANISSFLSTVMPQLQICSVNYSQRNTLLPFVNSWARFSEGLSGRKRRERGGGVMGWRGGKTSVIALCARWIVTNNGVPLLSELFL